MNTYLYGIVTFQFVSYKNASEWEFGCCVVVMLTSCQNSMTLCGSSRPLDVRPGIWCDLLVFQRSGVRSILFGYCA